MGATILCIEDNPQNMRLVRKILTGAGHRILEAVDARTGIEMAQRERPNLVLMDVNLPDIDGLEATRRLKAIPLVADIPVIALTANAMHGDRERCLEAGCNGYIPKPITKNELLNTVAHFLAQPVFRNASLTD
jgi:two-component system cell cycle response regulator DivK